MASTPTYGVRKNHPECPADRPHATVHNGTGEVVACHVKKSQAQDLALTLNIPDATTPDGGPAVIPASAAGDLPDLPVFIEVPALAEWNDVELVAAGEWALSTGVASFTTADLQAAVGAADCPAVGRPILKLGHADPRFTPDPAADGEPAIGWVAGMRLNDSMTKIVGNFQGMPGWLGEILPSAYPERSVEGAWNFPCQMGHIHPFVITAVALLGCTPPGVGIIASLNDIATLYGIEAAAPADPAALTPFTLNLGDAMPPAGSTVLAAGTNTTIDDVRREFYEEASWSRWIVELQLDPLVLIVGDDSTGSLFRVPVKLDPKNPGEVEFGPDEEVLVQYVTAPNQSAEAAKGGPKRRIVAAWASRETSRGTQFAAAWDAASQQANLGDDPTSAQLTAMYALPGDTKTGSKLPHHTVSSDGKVGDPDPDACSAAMGAINGARGGMTGVSDADKKKAYDHVAAHMTAMDMEPPDMKTAAAGAPEAVTARLERLQRIRAAAGDTDADENTSKLLASLDATLDQASALSAGIDRATVDEPTGQALDLITAAEAIADQLMELLGIFDPDDVTASGAAAGGAHGPFDGKHDHPHSAFGAQGGDATHTHGHAHTNDAVHAHVHEPMSAAPAATAKAKGAPEVEFTNEQLTQMRAKLGKKEDDELTAADIAAAFAAPTVEAAAAAGKDGDGTGGLPPIGEGTYLVDGEILRDYQTRAARGDHAAHQLRIFERDVILAAAIREGKFPQAKLETYQNRWDKDPEGTRELVESLAAGLVPMGGAVGNAGGDPDLPGDFEEQKAYKDLYPEDAKGGVSHAPGVRGGAYRG